MDLISTAIIALVVCVAYDIALKAIIMPLVKKIFNKDETTQG
jgi:hypothetical protein